jgi:hypothetical protein
MKNDILHFEKKYYILLNFLRKELFKQNYDDFMRIISSTRKFLSFFEENIDDSTCRKTLKNTSFRAQNVSLQNRLNIKFMNYFNYYRFFKSSKKKLNNEFYH